jgi:serine/threonine-protein kinase
MHIHEPPRAMSEISPDLPKELDAPVLAMVAKNPKDRPGSAGAAVAALRDRAEACGLAKRQAGDVATAPSSLTRALARHEMATVQIARAPKGPTPEEVAAAATPRPASAETSGPVVITVDRDADRTDEDASIARTMAAAAPPASETLTSPGMPEPSASVPATLPAAPALKVAPTLDVARPAPRPRRAWIWPLAASGAGIVAVVILLQQGQARQGPAVSAGQASASASSAAAPELPSKVTIRLAVAPPDADAILDGVRAGAASEALVLPRSAERHALRFEKAGFEAQTLWITPDRDQDLPPISLRAAAAPPVAPPSVKAQAKPAYHDDLEKPEYVRPK